MAVVGAVEGLYCLARVVVAEEGADLFHSFLAVVAEVVGDLLCSAIAVKDLRSVAVAAAVVAVEVADLRYLSRAGVSICSENLIFSCPTFWPN